LQIHTRVLRQRQGHPPAASERVQVEWASVLKLLDAQRQQQQTEVTQMQTEIENLRQTIAQTKSKIELQVEAYLQESKQVQALEQQHLATKQLSTELVAKVSLYQQIVQPLQDGIDTFKQQLAGLADTIEDRPENQQAMQNIESLLNNLVHGLPMES
jgi:chromosome segregation ATPase